MTDTDDVGGWQDRVADEHEPLGSQADWRMVPFEDAKAFARMTIECAVQPMIALVAELPEFLHFEMHARHDRASQGDR